MKTRIVRNRFLRPLFGADRRASRSAGFTMIEIAISLAVIAFALVAIIGILPTGMNVQRENREETIINQDANFLLNAIRNGERGIDDLTNYVLAITNTVGRYDLNRNLQNTAVYGYTFVGSSPNVNPPYPITNGYRIIGLLSTPKYIPLVNQNKEPDGYLSNHVVATVMALSGPASEKTPQTNSSVRELALSYRLILDVELYQPFDPWLGLVPPLDNNTNEWLAWSNYWQVAGNIKTNLHEVRMTYRWPLFQNNRLGSGRQVYRTMAGGDLTGTNEPGFPNYEQRLFFFEPRNYVKSEVKLP